VVGFPFVVKHQPHAFFGFVVLSQPLTPGRCVERCHASHAFVGLHGYKIRNNLDWEACWQEPGARLCGSFEKLPAFLINWRLKVKTTKKPRQPWLKLRQNFLISVSEQQVKKTVFLTP
jgi:hypothetical protein